MRLVRPLLLSPIAVVLVLACAKALSAIAFVAARPVSALVIVPYNASIASALSAMSCCISSALVL